MDVSADLHIHSTVSDGSDSFWQVLKLAVSHELTHIAFTNHDTVSGLNQAIRMGESLGISVIGGVEISAWDRELNSKVHILGLGLASENAPYIKALCDPLLERRYVNTRWQYEQLLQNWVLLDHQVVEYYDQISTCLYKQHLMAAITDEPFTSSLYTDIYQTLFKRGGICDREISYVDARDAVRAIKLDGGLAVLAHPGQQQNYAVVQRLHDCGLDGIEKYHPDHTESDWRIIDRLTTDYGLFQTGGSDYHGAFDSPAAPGVQRIDSIPAALREKLHC
ncbi:MAG: PHP domain-containing protein [Coriobacteriia bacterium]|nr:PHP domain-containing protein [Coriobacteriia bacterium]